MKRCAPLALVLLLTLLFVGCGTVLPNEEEEEPKEVAISPTAYRITAELSTAENLLSVHSEIEYNSPADGISAVKFYLYPNAYREGGCVVTEDKKEQAYPRGVPTHGGAEILSLSCDVPIADSDVGQDGLVLTVRLERDLEKGECVRFVIAEKVTLANVKHRLGYFDGYYYLSGFYPVVCPFSENRFLSYEYTPYGDPFRLENASFSLKLSLPVGVVCACSAEELRREKQGSTETYFYQAGSSREIAVVASEKLRAAKVEQNGKKLFYYYADGKDKERILSVIGEAMAYFEESFGAYPYPTYSVVAAPFFESGVEHSGMAIVASDLSFSQKKKTILHETAHQWWFGKVGNDEYLSPWIDEGLAEYSVAAYYHAKGHPEVYREIIHEAETAYSIRLALKGPAGVRFDLSLPDLAEGYYDRVYSGGLLLFSTLSERFSTRRFHAALKDFAERFDGEIASADDLISALSMSLGEDLTTLFRSWLTGVVPLQ